MWGIISYRCYKPPALGEPLTPLYSKAVLKIEKAWQEYNDRKIRMKGQQ